MKISKMLGLTLGALAVVCLLSIQPVHATTNITFLDSAGNPAVENPATPTHTSSDYSATGLNIGQAGHLFFNFGQTATTFGPVAQNAVVALPSWILVDFDPLSPTYSFGDDPGLEAFSKGGVAGWASLTLPDGTTGPSGALVDPASDNNSNNTIPGIGINIAGDFIMHVVVDNTNGDHDPASRLRAREDVSGEDSKLQGLLFDSSPDVYSFLYEGVVPGDSIKLQLNSGVFGEDASIAGIMFDVVPEPTSAALLVLGALGLVSRRRRR